MERTELEAKVIELVALSYGKNISEITLDTDFKQDLSGSSLQMVGLVAELENELDVTIALQEASACGTVEDLVNKVEEEL